MHHRKYVFFSFCLRVSVRGSSQCVWLQSPSLLITDATALCEGAKLSQHPQTPDQQHRQAKPQTHQWDQEVENRKINLEGSCEIGEKERKVRGREETWGEDAVDGRGRSAKDEGSETKWAETTATVHDIYYWILNLRWTVCNFWQRIKCCTSVRYHSVKGLCFNTDFVQ